MARADSEFDPDQHQMTIGDHLEELRHRLFMGIGGLLVAVIGCLFFGKTMVAILCAPLVEALQKQDISPQMYSDQIGDGFMTVIKMSVIMAAAITSPWILFQLWQFVRTGLYPHERKYVTKYIPLSITLLISGMLFVYFLVLPWTLRFFLGYAATIPSPISMTAAPHVPSTQPTVVESLAGDPASPLPAQLWFDTSQNRLKMFLDGKVRVINFGPDNLLAMQFTLTDYLSLVLQLLLMFGLAFQLPLVVNALARVGIVEIAQLKAFRRPVYFGLCVLAAAISPGDVVTATIALLVPLIFLYELGIFMASLKPKEETSGENAN